MSSMGCDGNPEDVWLEDCDCVVEAVCVCDRVVEAVTDDVSVRDGLPEDVPVIELERVWLGVADCVGVTDKDSDCTRVAIQVKHVNRAFP